ncbi:DegT/DnrJ/EryC1/StrS family aminotransferase [Streptomyces sp900105245]|uniref:DegT/DnrJ/EryC1/StrS family aminotransferase n=1 Tax=Streptomyces sp. 900105245 TaxID=3154379 RepID=A0ABV1UJ71_9ACTN
MNQIPRDLAVLGGAPWFDRPVAVGRPITGDRQRFMGRVHEILDRGQLSNNGPVVQEFEQRVAEALGVRHCISTCNATTGLQLALHAVGATGEVIVPSLTFVATAHAASWLGLRPVFCDVDPVTRTIDPDLVEALITPRTTAILGVHLWGRPCAVDRLAKIAHNHGVALLFDAAHAFGCTADGRAVGGFGQAEVFSFHATKVVNSFEGGAVVTNDEEFARTVRSMRNFGMDEERQVRSLGLNAKMSEVGAAMGLTSLEAFPRTIEVNMRNFLAYQEELSGIPQITLLDFQPGESHNYGYVVIEVTPDEDGITRDVLFQALRAENVISQRYFSPGVHTMPPYAAPAHRLPITDRVASRVLALPTGPDTTRQEINAISMLIRLACGNGRAVSRRLQHARSTLPSPTGAQ